MRDQGGGHSLWQAPGGVCAHSGPVGVVPAGAGKTHTMLGMDAEPGIYLQTLADLFRAIERTRDSVDSSVSMSYLEVSCYLPQAPDLPGGRVTPNALCKPPPPSSRFWWTRSRRREPCPLLLWLLCLAQIYNEVIRDLLNPSSGLLELREDARGSIQIAGITEVSTSNAQEVRARRHAPRGQGVLLLRFAAEPGTQPSVAPQLGAGQHLHLPALLACAPRRLPRTPWLSPHHCRSPPPCSDAPLQRPPLAVAVMQAASVTLGALPTLRWLLSKGECGHRCSPAPAVCPQAPQCHPHSTALRVGSHRPGTFKGSACPTAVLQPCGLGRGAVGEGLQVDAGLLAYSVASTAPSPSPLLTVLARVRTVGAEQGLLGVVSTAACS